MFSTTSLTKTDQVKAFLLEGNTKEALRIGRTFKVGLTTEQTKALRTGYECILHPDQYRQMKVDLPKAIATAVSILCNLVMGE